MELTIGPSTFFFFTHTRKLGGLEHIFIKWSLLAQYASGRASNFHINEEIELNFKFWKWSFQEIMWSGRSYCFPKKVILAWHERREISCEVLQSSENSSKIICCSNTTNKKPETWPLWYFFSMLNCFFFLSPGKTYLQLYKKSLWKSWIYFTKSLSWNISTC